VVDDSGKTGNPMPCRAETEFADMPSNTTTAPAANQCLIVEKILHGCLRETVQPNLASYDRTSNIIGSLENDTVFEVALPPDRGTSCSFNNRKCGLYLIMLQRKIGVLAYANFFQAVAEPKRIDARQVQQG
jgi:hypothetical protein